jgi:hypothetical protein
MHKLCQTCPNFDRQVADRRWDNVQNLRRSEPRGGEWARSLHQMIKQTFQQKTRTGANSMIRKLASGEFRLYSRKKNPKTGRRRNLGTFPTRAAAEKHEREVQYFKRNT